MAKILGIAGGTASGKTTVVELLSIIYDIFSNYRINSSKNIFKFIDNTVNLDRLSEQPTNKLYEDNTEDDKFFDDFFSDE